MTVQLPPTGSPPPPMEAQDSWRTYLDLLLRWWWVFFLAAVLAGAAAAWVSFNQTPIYRVSTKLLINQATSPNNAYQDVLLSERVAATYAEWMNQPALIEETVVQLGLPRDRRVIGEQITSVSVAPVRNSQILDLVVEGPNPDLITAFARTLPQVFAQQTRDVQTRRFAETKSSLTARMADLTKRIETTQTAIGLIGDTRDFQQQQEYNRLAEELSRARTNYDNLAATYETLLLTEAQSVDTIAVIEAPARPNSPVEPRPLRTTALAMVVGAMLAAGLVFLYEIYIDRFRSTDEVRQMLLTPILGTISRIAKIEDYSHKALIAVTDPRSPDVESLRRLRTNLRFADVDANLHTMAITSANSNEGKSVIAANLAVVMAQAGLSVVLVDADMRKPKQHHIFELSRGPGLSDALYNESFEGLEMLLQPTAVPNLQLLTAGRKAPNPAELLGSRRMQQLLATLREQVDFVLLDTPPILAVSDSQVIGTQIDGSMLILDTQKTTRKMARMAVEALDQVNARLLGVTINRIDSRARGYYYYYDNYHYYDDDGEDDGKGRGKRGWRWPWERRAPESSRLREQRAYISTQSE